MIFSISTLHQLAATASGVDKAGHAVQVDLTAYVIDAGDPETAISVVEAEVLNEAVISDGTGGFTKPTLVTATSVDLATVLPAAPLIYRHTGPGADAKFSVSSVYAIQVLASIPRASATVTVYPLNSALKASIALSKSDVMQLPVVPDPDVPGKLDKPQKVAAISGDPVTSAPLSAKILVASVVIPNWPTAETVDRGEVVCLPRVRWVYR